MQAVVKPIQNMLRCPCTSLTKVCVTPNDYYALRFLWWPQEFQMLVHLSGATSSPSGVNFALCL